jgi:lactate dehydrogenase-like 2-hydroxyacid dehydrogenase
MTNQPKVIVCDHMLMGYFGSLLDEFDPPPFWDAADPMARLREIGGEAKVLITYGGNPRLPGLVEALPNLEAVLVSGAGYEGIDFDMLKVRGIACANNGPGNSEDVADLALGMALAARREIIAGDRFVRDGSWTATGGITKSFCAMRAGIVGYGYIGKAIARRLDGFGMETSWWGPRPQPAETRPRTETLLELAKASDLLFVACPGGEATRRLINREIIEAVGPDGLIVTVARGSVIDEDALIGALRDGRLGGAGLDVFEKEPTPAERWADVPNVVLSPHRGGITDAARLRTIELTKQNIRRVLAGEEVMYRLA